MKKYSGILSVLMVICLMLGTASCSKENKSADLYGKLPKDADVAMVVDLPTLLTSARAKYDHDRLILPEYITSRKGFEADDLAKFNELINEGGVDEKYIGLCIYTSPSIAAAIYKLRDADAYEKFIEREGFEVATKGDRTVYSRVVKGVQSSESVYCTICDGYGYIFIFDGVGSSENVGRLIDKVIESARKESLATAGAGKYAMEGHSGGMVVNLGSLLNLSASRAGLPLPLSQFNDKLTAVKFDIEGDEIEVESALFDKEGKRIQMSEIYTGFDTKAKISKDALAYISPEENMVYAIALKGVNWDEVVKSVGDALGVNPMQRIMLSMAKTYLEKIDGTVALGLGFDGTSIDLENIINGANPLPYMPITLVAQTTSNSAKGMIGDFSALFASMGLSTHTTSDGFSVPLPSGLGSIYGFYKDNLVVLSTRPVKEYGYNEAVADADMEKYLGAFGLYLPAANPLMQKLEIDKTLLLTSVNDAADSESEMKLKLSGTPECGIVESLLRICFRIADSERSEALEAPSLEEDMEDIDHYGDFEPTYF